MLLHYVEIFVAPDGGASEFRRLFTSKLLWPERYQAIEQAAIVAREMLERFEMNVETWLPVEGGEHFGITDNDVVVDIRIMSTTEGQQSCVG